MTRETVRRARHILEIFAEAQGWGHETIDDAHARVRTWRLEQWRKNSANRRAAARATRSSSPKKVPLTKEQKEERRRAARRKHRKRVQAEIAALRAARKAAA